MGSILASGFYRFWLILGAMLGGKIKQKSIKNGIEKTIEKRRASKWPTRRSKSLRGCGTPPRPTERSPPLRRDSPLGPTQIRASRILASKVLYSPLEYLKVL